MMEPRAAIFLGWATDGSGSYVKKYLKDFYFSSMHAKKFCNILSAKIFVKNLLKNFIFTWNHGKTIFATSSG